MSIIVYDGDCNMCSTFIRGIVKINKNESLKITSLSSEWSVKNLELSSDIDSIVFIHNGKHYLYSDAIFALLASSNGLFKPLIILRVVPRFIRDRIYKFVASRRKNIFPSTTCRLPTKKEKDMFLR